MTSLVLSVCRCIQLSQSSAIWRGAAPTVVSGARPHEGSQKAQACAHKGKCPPWRALGAMLRATRRDLSPPVRGSVHSRDDMMAGRGGPDLDVRSPVETLPMSVSVEVRATTLSVSLRFTGTHCRARPLFRSRRAQVGLRTGARLRQRDRVVPRRGTTSAHPPLPRTRFTLLHTHLDVSIADVKH